MKFVIKSGSLVKLYSGDMKIEALAQFLKENFPSQNPNYLQYVDDQGDSIRIDSQDYLEALLLINSSSQYAKLELITTFPCQPSKESQKIESQASLPQEKPESDQIFQKIKENQSKSLSSKKSNENLQTKHEKEKSPKNSRSCKRKMDKTNFKESEDSSIQKSKSFERLVNDKMASMIDERIKMLIPCLKNQLQQDFEVQIVSSPSVHSGIECKGCGVIPIVGIRYKCLECPNFSFCSDCEQKIDHSHNLLKMRKTEAAEISSKKPAQQLWKHCRKYFGKRHRGASSSFEKDGRKHKYHHQRTKRSEKCHQNPKERKMNKKLFKLKSIFGEQPNFQEFIEKYPELKPKELISVYATQNKIPFEEVQAKKDAAKKQKLSAFYECPEEEFNLVVKTYPTLSFREIIMKLKETGERVYNGENFKRMRAKTKKNQLGREAQNSTSKAKEQLPQPKANSREKSLQKRSKRIICEKMTDLFGQNKDYRQFVEENFTLGQAEIIFKWIERISA